MSKKINISDKELDRDIVNLNVPEIDWDSPNSGYPKNFTKDSIDKRKSKRSNVG